jgi:Zn-dependent protease/predicted transcriptional regulator
MRWSAKLFTIRGIDVKVHVTFLLVVALGALQWSARGGLVGAAFGAVFMLALFTSVLLHELGHSFVARHFGLKVKDILLLPIGGIASLQGRPSTPRQEIAIALAGPAVNVVLAMGFAAALWLNGQAPTTAKEFAALTANPSLSALLLLLASGNASLAFFNLLPIFPLDGGRVLRALLETRLGSARGTAWAAGIGQVASAGLLGYAILSGQLLLGLIAVLVFLAAGQESLQARLEVPMSSLTAGDVAELPAVDLDASMRVRDALPWLLRTQQAALPVVSNGAVLGVVLRAELLAAGSSPDGAPISIRAIMRKVPQLDGSLPLQVALQQLREADAPVAVVTGPEYPLGLLSESQVLMKLAQAPNAPWRTTSPTGTASRPSSALDAP